MSENLLDVCNTYEIRRRLQHEKLKEITGLELCGDFEYFDMKLEHSIRGGYGQPYLYKLTITSLKKKEKATDFPLDEFSAFACGLRGIHRGTKTNETKHFLFKK